MFYWTQKKFKPLRLSQELDLTVTTVNLWDNTLKEVCIRYAFVGKNSLKIHM